MILNQLKMQSSIILNLFKGIVDSGLKILYSKKVLNSIESESDWWNGLYLVVVEKKNGNNN
jgi:hypothetical protein